jgi:hypothetical protein
MKYMQAMAIAILISTIVSCEKTSAQAEAAPPLKSNSQISLYGGSAVVRSWGKATKIRMNSDYANLITFVSEGKTWTINGTFIVEN